VDSNGRLKSAPIKSGEGIVLPRQEWGAGPPIEVKEGLVHIASHGSLTNIDISSAAIRDPNEKKPDVVIFGVSSAGKSSLITSIAGKDLKYLEKCLFEDALKYTLNTLNPFGSLVLLPVSVLDLYFDKKKKKK